MKSDFNKEVSSRLRKLREASAFSTAPSFSELLNVEYSRYNHWETGQIMLPLKQAIQICEKFGCTLDYIYRGKENIKYDQIEEIFSTLKGALEGFGLTNAQVDGIIDIIKETADETVDPTETLDKLSVKRVIATSATRKFLKKAVANK